MSRQNTSSGLPEGSILRDAERHARFALFAVWQRLMPVEYVSTPSQELVVRNCALADREILSVLRKRDRVFFIKHMGGKSSGEKYLTMEKTPSDRQYDRAMYAWRALGTTVLVHPELTEDALRFDQELLDAGIKFKQWYFHSCFSSPFLDEDGIPQWPGIALTITLIKRLSAFITYYSAFDTRVELPNRIDPMPGSGQVHQEFTWFDGSLKAYRKPWLLSPNRLSVLSLSQMSGFGRALPPATGDMAHGDAEETMNFLSTEFKTDQFWLDAFGIAATRLSSRMTKLPVETHCSINATACYEATQEEGGLASYVVKCVNNLLLEDFDMMMQDIINVPDQMYDPFGRVVIDRAITWRTNKRRSNILNLGKFPDELPYMPLAQGINRKILFGHIAYRGSFLDPNVNNGRAWNLPNANPHGGLRFNRDLYEAFKDEKFCLYNETLGDIVALWAFSQAIKYGHFVDNKGLTVKPLFETLAIFDSPGPKIWVQDFPVPAKLMALEEPGWKARTLTKNRAFVVILQALIRHPIAEVLASDGRVGFGLKSSYILWDFLKLVNKKRFDKTWYLVSTDLSRSTDLIPHDLLKIIWKNFLPGAGLSPRHPLFCLRNMIMLDHTVSYRRPDKSLRTIDHKCGSFMGEPVSFMGLSLYNLCVSEIAAFMRLRNLPLAEFSLDEFRHSGPNPSGYVAIVGDDRKELTNIPHMFENVNYLYKVTNGSPSRGKNIVSKYHGTLAENHTYFDGSTIVYLDTIKPKLLTSSTRYHSDNQSSIIGKGAQLHVQLEWYKTNTNLSNCPADNARVIYTINMLKGFFPKDIKCALTLPIYLPTSVGGISFPIKLTDAYRYGISFMSFVEWLILDSTTTEFLEFSMKISDITAGVKRGLPSSGLSQVWGSHFSGLIKKLDLTNESDFDPELKTGIFNLNSILNYVSEKHKEINISSVTGRPHVALSIALISKEYGFLPIESMLDVIDRQSTFIKAFSEGVTKKEKLSFHKYVARSKRFWSEIPTKIQSGKPRFHSWDEVHWFYGRRLKAFVHESVFGDDNFSSGPTLFLRTKRHSGVTRTKQGWDSLKNHALTAYLARVRQEFEVDYTSGESSKEASAPTIPTKTWKVEHHRLTSADRIQIR